jgi:hypothetical protein
MSLVSDATYSKHFLASRSKSVVASSISRTSGQPPCVSDIQNVQRSLLTGGVEPRGSITREKTARYAFSSAARRLGALRIRRGLPWTPIPIIRDQQMFVRKVKVVIEKGKQTSLGPP